MKNINLLFLVFCFGIHLTGQEVPEVQHCMITKVTATWCPPCGGWAWDAFDEVYKNNDTSTLVIANNYSGDLVSYTASQFAENLGAFGQPLFYLNNDRLSFSASTYKTSLSALNDDIATIVTMNPIANTGIYANLEGRTLTVDTKTKFFQSTSGEFYLGAYIIENGVVNYQASRGNDAVHKNVLRESMSKDKAFGEKIAGGNIATDTEIEMSFSLDIPQEWDIEKSFIATIIWKLEEGIYQYVNSFMHFDWQNSTSLDDLTQSGASLEILQNEGSSITTSYSNPNPSRYITYHFLDGAGRVLETRNSYHVGQTSDNQSWDTSSLPLGIYYVRILEANGQLVRKILVR